MQWMHATLAAAAVTVAAVAQPATAVAVAAAALAQSAAALAVGAAPLAQPAIALAAAAVALAAAHDIWVLSQFVRYVHRLGKLQLLLRAVQLAVCHPWFPRCI